MSESVSAALPADAVPPPPKELTVAKLPLPKSRGPKFCGGAKGWCQAYKRALDMRADRAVPCQGKDCDVWFHSRECA